jgi:hypothetical protein
LDDKSRGETGIRTVDHGGGEAETGHDTSDVCIGRVNAQLLSASYPNETHHFQVETKLFEAFDGVRSNIFRPVVTAE